MKRNRLGRPPKSEESIRRDLLLDHALAQFMAIGYRATTMAGLVRSFGASKSTLYRQYGSKAGLLRAAMERGVPLLFNRLSKVTIDPGRDPRDVLRDFGAVIQTYHADPGIVAMWRAVVEAREDLGDFLDTAVHQRTRALAPIADYLVALAQDRRLSIRDPDAAAAAFSELVSGGLTAFLGSPPSGKARAAALEFALSLLLDGMRPRHGESTVMR
ncbi:MAG: TetR/AcrR family transcriptional regulator [Steroidobacteraceae bacterium]